MALVVAVAVFSMIYAVAASLGVSTETLGAGNSNVSSCDTDGVATAYTTSYSATSGGFVVADVNVSGIAAACGSKTMKVTLVGATDTELASQTVTLAATPANPTAVTFSTSVLASAVIKVAVVIAG